MSAADADHTNCLAAAKAMLDHVTQPVDNLAGGAKTVAEYMRRGHGPGLFYASFETPEAAAAYAAAPTTEGIWYFDETESRARYMPDGALGALVAGRAGAIVVVDQLTTPGIRCQSDSLGNVTWQCCDMAKVPLAATPSRDHIDSAYHAKAEALVRKKMAQGLVVSGGDLMYIEPNDDDDDDDDDDADLTICHVPQPDAVAAVRDMTAKHGGPVASLDRLLWLLERCGPGQIIIWAQGVSEEYDVAWPFTIAEAAGTGQP